MTTYEEDNNATPTLRELTLTTPFPDAPALERWRAWMLRTLLRQGNAVARARAIIALAQLDPASQLITSILDEDERRAYHFRSRRELHDTYTRANTVAGYTYAALRDLEQYGLTGETAVYLKQRAEIPDALVYLSAMAQALVLAAALRQGLVHPVFGRARPRATQSAPAVPRAVTAHRASARLENAIAMTSTPVTIEDAGPGMAKAVVAGATSLWPLSEGPGADFEDVLAGNDAAEGGAGTVTRNADTFDAVNFGTGAGLDGSSWLAPADGVDVSAGLWASTQAFITAFPATLLFFQYGSGDTLALQTDGIGTLQVEVFSTADGYPVTLTGPALSLSTPYHIAFSYDVSGEQLRLSVDGDGATPASLSGYSAIDPSGGEAIYFGRNPVGALLTGNLGYVALAPGATLTQGELDALTA